MDDDEPPQKRFKYQSYSQGLKEVHLPAARLEPEIGDSESHFNVSLDHWRQLNLSASFIKFAREAEPLSASLPLLLHHWNQIFQLWLTALEAADDEGLNVLLDLLQQLLQDLHTTMAPIYGQLLDRLLPFLTRTIAPATLTILLTTFSSIFKHLLIPTKDSQILQESWSKIRNVLPKCLPEVQRAMAEVWGSVLRRLKAEARSEAVVLMTEGLENVQDATAWAFVSACKSVSQTLHTATPTIFSPLLNQHLVCESHPATFTLIRRLLTALIHHVKNAEQFSPISDVLVNDLLTRSGKVDSDREKEELRRLLEVVAVSCSVRRGSRLTEKHLTTILTTSLTIPITPSFHDVLLKIVTSALVAGEMPLWLSSGRKLLEQSWTDTRFVIQLHGTLAELGWGGWKMIALPTLLKKTGQLLEVEPARTFELLAACQKEHKLGEVDMVWKQKLNKAICSRLGQWKLSDESAAELNDILGLSVYFSAEVTPLLVDIIGRLCDEEQTGTDVFPSPSWALSACLQSLSTRPAAEWSGLLDATELNRNCLKKWNRSPGVLGGLLDLTAVKGSHSKPLEFEEAYSCLQQALLSHAHLLRLNALRLLASDAIATPPGVLDVVKRCLQGEEVSIDIQGVRERVIRIGKVDQIVKDDGSMGIDVCTRWLIGQLKINLRPLWAPTAVALATLSQRFDDEVWRLIFAEFQAEDGEKAAVGQDDVHSQEEDDPWEEERTWRDPSAHKFRAAVLKWTSDNRFELSKAQGPNERFQPGSYELQLLTALQQCSALAEKHNRDLVPFFLARAGADAEHKLARQKLSAWLTLFSKFTNPKALYMTETLRDLYVSLLSHPDRALQAVSLSCLLTYKSRHLSAHEDKLRGLLDETRWRDELMTLGLEAMDGQDRTEVIDVVIRLLFGMMLEKKGRSRGSDRRIGILSALAGCSPSELELLADLMLHPFGLDGQSRREEQFEIRAVSVGEKQQSGFLTLLGDVLKILGPAMLRYWPSLLAAVVDITSSAHASTHTDVAVEEEPEAEEPTEDADEASPASSSRAIRSLRQLGLKRINQFFKCPVSFNFAPYMKACFTAFISPRLSFLSAENTQNPSTLLELFFTWSSSPVHFRLLVDYDARVLPQIYGCLVATNVKPAVTSRIFDIVEQLLGWSTTEEFALENLVKPYISLLLTNLAILVERTKGGPPVASPLVQRQISILSQVAQYSTNHDEAVMLLDLFGPLLRRPPKVVPEKVKVDILNVVGHLLPLIPELADATAAPYKKVYELLVQLFQSLRSRPARLNLVTTFQVLASINGSIQSLAELLQSLNAYSTRRVDEPDFDKRLEAFSSLNDTLYQTLSSHEWLPLLYNMLSFLQDPTELAVRTSASQSLKLFVDLVASHPSSEYEATFMKVLFPGLKNGLRSRNEMVRAEVLNVIAHAVRHCTSISSLQDMRVLLANGDDEANFFNNIHHVQVHRRSRALRRLADLCDEQPLKNATLIDIIIPLVANYIAATSTVDHHLVTEAIAATGRLSKHLTWSSYNSLVQKYLRLARAKDESERVYVRALVALLENFNFSMDEVAPVAVQPEQDVEEDEDPIPAEEVAPTTNQGHIADIVNLRLLPTLLRFVELRDSTTEESVRIPVAGGIVNIAKRLPEAIGRPQITRLLTIISQVFRSRSQDMRDLTRETLTKITVSLGSSYFALVIRELRGALLRGPQLHILAFVTHSLLTHITTGECAAAFQVLDDSVPDVAHIAAEVIFGESGKDVMAEEFKTKMREVRGSSSKGLDTFAIMAQHITPAKISALLHPLRSIMQETESIKTMQLVDEVFKRMINGFNANKHLVPTELISLCHTLISQNARFLKEAPPRRKKAIKDDVTVQLKRKEAADRDHYSNNSFRFVAFGLDLFNTALRRNRFDFRDISILSRLETMVVAVGNVLYSTNSPVLILGMKCVAGIVKCPLKSLDKSLPIFIRQILDIVKQAGNTEADVVQIALRSLATVLRDSPGVQVKEQDLIYLLELISPDLEEPERQASVFTMLRAIVARKFVVPEIYDIMERVAEVMVTSQSPQVQEMCRGVLLQFLLDYPQGKGRLRTQMTFLAKNLSYVHESGRKSVMELLGAVVEKFQVTLIREYSDLLFVALVMVIANDESPKCKEMAAQLIKSLVVKQQDAQRQEVMNHLKSWASQQTKPQLTRVSFQIYGLVIDALGANSLPYVPAILGMVDSALSRSTEQLESAEEDSMEVDLDWQTPYYALIVLSKVCREFSERTSDMNWSFIVAHLLFPHAWVRTVSCRLVGLLFSGIPVTAPSTSPLVPMTLEGMTDVATKLCLQLKSDNLDDALGVQIVKNLFYIGKCFYMVPGTDRPVELDEEAESADAKRQDPLPWLFSRLSYQARSSHIARRNRRTNNANWCQQPSSVFRWFAAMAAHMDPSRLEQFLVHILTPLYRIIEDDSIHDTQIADLKALGIELQDLVQGKVGVTKFSTVYSQIRQGALGVQRERKTARALQVATNPEAAAKRKFQRNSVKKESRKRKNHVFADGRGSSKKSRAE